MKQVKFKTSFRLMALLLGLFLSVGAFAQQITVQGHVKDATGEAIIGATVRIVGQDNGVITDFDGNFVIKANEGQQLQVSYIGYKTATAAVAPKLVITLEEDAQTLNDVVVIGYGAVKKNEHRGQSSLTKLTRSFIIATTCVIRSIDSSTPLLATIGAKRSAISSFDLRRMYSWLNQMPF